MGSKLKGKNMEANLEQCVTYFTNGSWPEWISGGLIVGVTLIATLTKWNVPSFLKKIFRLETK